MRMLFSAHGLKQRYPWASMALRWVKSSFSYANGNCVEVAGLLGKVILIRDSKDADGPVLAFSPDEWDAFLDGVRNGEFDRCTSTR